jgi:excisionase family DNA binding protein
MHPFVHAQLRAASLAPADTIRGGKRDLRLAEEAAERLLIADEAAERLRVAKQTLARWRVEGQGPPFIRLGSRVLYRVADVDAYIAEHRFHSTAEADRAAAS